MTSPRLVRPLLAVSAGTAYLLTIVAANWAIHRYGIVPVGFGYTAPAAVYFVAAALLLRNAFQLGLGRRAGTRPKLWQLLVMLAVILLGATLSFVVADANLARASFAAFAASEVLDFAVFTLIAPRWGRAVLLAGLAGALLDSVVFLHLAFHSLHFLPGQLLGKAYGVVAVALLVGIAHHTVPRWQRRRSAPATATA